MKNYCKRCSATVDARLRNCPLCGEYLSDTVYRGYEAYPKYEETAEKKSMGFFTKLMIFLSVIVGLVCVFINILTWKNYLWSGFVVAGILYLWLFVAHTVLSKTSVGMKILIQLIIVSLAIYVIERVSPAGHWALDYVIPFVIMCATLVMIIFSLVKRMHWRDYVLYLLMVVALGFVPIVLFAFGLAQVVWPSATAALFSLLTLIGMIIFADKEIKNETKKRFHL